MPTQINGSTGVSKVQDGVVVTADIADLAVTKEKLNSGVVPIGVDQTWQDVTASRAVNDNYYTNDTGRPIQVAVRTQQSGSGTTICYVDGVVVAAYQQQNVSGFHTCSFIVPAGSQYKCTRVNNTLTTWAELR